MALDSEVHVVTSVKPWVWGPHCKERLGNRPYVVFSCPRLDLTLIGSTSSGANASEEDLKHGYFILDGLEKGIDAQVSCVLDPFLPVGIGGGGSTSRDPALHFFMRSTEITAELIGKGRVASL